MNIPTNVLLNGLALVLICLFSVNTFVFSQQKKGVGSDKIANGTVYNIMIRNSQQDSSSYHVFIPEGLKEVRAVLIHQHGCGMEGRGLSTAYDIQYQALAKKWGLAIVGPDLYYANGCHAWREPSAGSGSSLIEALGLIGLQSNLISLRDSPWLLWGHSGGGYWTLAMMKAYPERIMATVCYSPAFDPSGDYPEEALSIPILIRHAGANDANSKDVECWITALNAFTHLRSQGGLASIAHTPYENHNFSFLRYIAIPFYEAVLIQRLPSKQGATYKDMKNMIPSEGWLADTSTINTYPYEEIKEKHNTMAWLPDSLTAAKWKEYIITGTVRDRTAPAGPYGLKARRLHNVAVELSWRADADIESGIKCFHIYRGDQLVDRFPKVDSYQRFDTNGDDAIPMFDLPDMKYIVNIEKVAKQPIYITVVNHFDIESERIEFATID